jgi:DNA-binding MarR family transcriptional regulator
MDRVKQIANEMALIAPKWHMVMRIASLLPASLTVSQVSVLLIVFEQGATTSARLAKALHVSAPTITGLVDRLFRQRYVERIPSEKDRRVVYIKLTQKGQAQVRTFFNRMRKRWESILSLIEPREQEILLSLIKKILYVAQKRDDRKDN